MDQFLFQLTQETSSLLFIDKPHNLSPSVVQQTSFNDLEAVKEEQSDSADYFAFDDDHGTSVKDEGNYFFMY